MTFDEIYYYMTYHRNKLLESVDTGLDNDIEAFNIVIENLKNEQKLKEAIRNIKAETEAWIEKTKSYTYYFGKMKAEGMQQVLDIINKHTKELI